MFIHHPRLPRIHQSRTRFGERAEAGEIQGHSGRHPAIGPRQYLTSRGTRVRDQHPRGENLHRQRSTQRRTSDLVRQTGRRAIENPLMATESPSHFYNLRLGEGTHDTTRAALPISTDHLIEPTIECLREEQKKILHRAGGVFFGIQEIEYFTTKLPSPYYV